MYAIFPPEVSFVLCLFYATPGVPCLGDSSDKSSGVYMRVTFMIVFVVYPEAIIQVWLL